MCGPADNIVQPQYDDVICNRVLLFLLGSLLYLFLWLMFYVVLTNNSFLLRRWQRNPPTSSEWSDSRPFQSPQYMKSVWAHGWGQNVYVFLLAFIHIIYLYNVNCDNDFNFFLTSKSWVIYSYITCFLRTLIFVLFTHLLIFKRSCYIIRLTRNPGEGLNSFVLLSWVATLDIWTVSIKAQLRYMFDYRQLIFSYSRP